MSRERDLKQFYQLLDALEQEAGGKRLLADCDGRMDWPERGVYFFFEPGEKCTNSGTGMRVVRVGTHAISGNSRRKLWERLAQHRGTQKTGSGNHRGSVFRELVGTAMKRRDHTDEPKTWGERNGLSAAAMEFGIDKAELRESEKPLERKVSRYIGHMPFLWLGIDDAPGPASLRAVIEKNSIALLSNFERERQDPPSQSWLGNNSDRDRVRRSGLWNSNHVDEMYYPDFLAALKQQI